MSSSVQFMGTKYNYEIYDKNWDRESSDYSQLLVKFLVKTLSKHKSSSILEIGFGSGRVASILNRVEFQGKYLGFDVQSSAVEFSKKLKLDESKFRFLELNELKSESLILESDIDLVVFCLSLCEMDIATVNKYLDFLKNNYIKSVLVINPSSQTQLFPSKIYKSVASKFLSRIGIQPKWFLKSEIIDSEKAFPAKIQGKSDVCVFQISRSLGNTIQLFLNKEFNLVRYEDIRFEIENMEHPTISRFEAMWFEKNTA